MGFTKRVSASNQRHRLFVVHGHAAEGFANIVRRQHRIRIAVGALRVHINESHLYSRESFSQLTTLSVPLIRQHLGFGAPVNPLRLPVVGAPTGKAEGLEAHVLHGHVARQHHQVCPGNLVAILLLDRPQQATRFVEIAVIRPTVQRLKSLLAAVGTAAAICRAVGTRAVPGHAHKERSVVTVISRPPWLRRRERGVDIGFQCLEIELGKLRSVIKITAKRVGAALILPQGR